MLSCLLGLIVLVPDAVLTAGSHKIDPPLPLLFGAESFFWHRFFGPDKLHSFSLSQDILLGTGPALCIRMFVSP